MLARTAFALALTSLLGAAGSTASAQIPERKDFQIAQDVSRAMRTYVNYTVFDDVSARVDNGAVTLMGKVTMPYKRDEIDKRVAGVSGVSNVTNQIEVMPVSIYDDELRHEIARALYGNPSFWHYASMPNPPIHIVVEGGRVTLTGVVQNNVERMLARSIATSYGAFSVQNNLKTDAEMDAQVETQTN